MANKRNTALLKVAPRQNWGGTYFSERTWLSRFNSYSPKHFGMMAAQTFSSQVGEKRINKPMLYLTQGMGNVMELDPGQHDYTWSLATDGNIRSVITDVDPNLPARPGQAGTTFRICLNKRIYHEPVVLKTEATQMPMLMIVGQPDTESPTKHWYTVKIQSGDASAYVDPKWLQVDMTVIDATTSIADSQNYKHGGIELGSQYTLGGMIGYFGRKIEFEDKMIRHEMRARMQGKSPGKMFNFDGKSYDSAVGTGYVIVEKAKDGKYTKEAIKAGTFIPEAQYLLEERIAKDKEWNMLFGQNQVTIDEDTGKPKRVGAGWFQIARDGYYREHTGNLTLQDLVSEITSKYFYATDPDIQSRKVYIRTGSEGMQFISSQISAEAGLSPFIFESSYFVGDASYKQGVNKQELAFGAQFTEFRAANGVTLCFVLDPNKDDPHMFRELDEDTGRPKESSSFDIMDLGRSSSNPDQNGSGSNISMIWEPAAEVNVVVSNVYDPITGAINDGSKVSNFNKDVGFYRESSGKLEVWDVSRIMRWARI